MTTVSDMLFQLGGVPAMAGVPFSRDAKYFFVDPARGSNDNNGTSPERAFAGLEAAEDACVANRHDTIFYIAGATTMELAAALVWDKSYTHLIGICAPTHAAQRARINQESIAASPLITISASGCIFKNLYIFHGVADAASLVNIQVTGGRNFFHNVHFAGGGHATQAIDTGASLLLNGAEENLFQDCTIGVDTIPAATGMAGLVFAATGGAARNVFRDCRFTMKAGAAGAIFVELLGNSGIDRYQIFERCLFINLAATAMSQAFAVAAGFDANDKRVILKDCALLGATDWDAANRGILYLSGGTATSGGYTGLLQASVVT